MLTYRHGKYPHTQEVQEWEKVRIALLEKAGWRKVKEPLPEPEPTSEDAPPAETPKPKEAATSRNPTRRKRRKNAYVGNLPEDAK